MLSNEKWKSLLDDQILKIYGDNVGDSKRIEIVDLFLRQNEDVIVAIKTISFLYRNYDSFQNELLSVAKDELYKQVLSILQNYDSIFENNLEEKVKAALKCIMTINVNVSDEMMRQLFSLDAEERNLFLSKNLSFDTKRLEALFEETLETDLTIRRSTNQRTDVNPNFLDYNLEYGILDHLLENLTIKLRNPLFVVPPEFNKTKKLYEARGYHLEDESQFRKYALIEINENRTLLEGYPRILDLKYNISIDVVGVGESIYHFLRNLQQKYDFVLSLKPHFLYSYDRIYEAVPLLEALQRGKCFDLKDISQKEMVSQLYDFKKDNLWVQITKDAITFEEILYDYLVYNNYYVTQVVHLMLSKGQGLTISHLDHEFIMYDEKSFEARQTKAKIKGEKRVKTFKIDNAAIPLDIKFVLAPILLLLFRNKELVTEYFQISRN